MFTILFLIFTIICEKVYCIENISVTSKNVTQIAYLNKQFGLKCPKINSIIFWNMVLWKFDGKRIPSYRNKTEKSDQLKYIASNGSITISKVLYNDSKNYSCEVYNTTLIHKGRITLIVKGPPNKIISFNYTSNNPKELMFLWVANSTLVNTVENFNLTLCPKPLINNCQNKVLQPSVKNYTFKNLQPYHTYSASIAAVNSIGFSERFDITARTTSGHPTAKPYVVKSNSTETEVIFVINCSDCLDESKMKGKFKHYMVKYNKAKEDIKTKNMSYNNETKQQVIINNLQPYSTYEFYIYASNGIHIGPGIFQQVRTKITKPKPVKNFRPGRITSTAIEVVWEPYNDEYGPIEEYKLKVDEYGLQTNEDISLPPFVSKYTINNLKTNTLYNISLFSVNKAGQSESAVTRAKTDRPDPYAPILLNVDFVDDGIRVEWIDPNFKNISLTDNSTVEVCWHQKIQELNVCETLRKGQEYYLKCSCNTSVIPIRCKVILPLVQFNLNKTVIYVFYLRAMVPSNTCQEMLSCPKLESSSNIKELKMSDFGTVYQNNRIILAMAFTATAALITIVVFILLLCKTNLKNSCVSRRNTACYSISGDYLEGYNHQPSLIKITPLEKTPYPPIPVSNLIDHILRYRADDGAGFQAEFEAIESMDNGRFFTSVAKAKENLSKNRYTNVFPYDHSRVQLQNPVNGKSDYINASFVDGYHRPKAYIATQGPLKETVCDFWQMIWEQNTEIIVMISNFIERGRCKCEEYWTRKETTYGIISVRLVYENAMAFYTERRFRIKNMKNKKSGNKERLVYHYQYTDWRDFDVPPSSLPVLVFIRASIRNWTDRSGPIVIHCSAGVGRTGTYICIDSQIRQMEAEHQINVRGFLEHIRQQRMKLVQTESQYTFIHDALYEYYLYPDHEVYKDDLSTYIFRLHEINPASGLQNIDIQFKLCVQFEPNDYELVDSRNKVNMMKNRSDIVPINSRRINLASEPGIEGSNYINASIIQGYWEMKEYIITQHPMEQTEHDFWKMVWDENCSLIILLSSDNEPLSNSVTNVESSLGDLQGPSQLHKFWPQNETDSRSFRGGMRVSYRSHVNAPAVTTVDDEINGIAGNIAANSGFSTYEFMLSSTAEDYAQNVTMHQLKHWPTLGSSTQYNQLIRLLQLLQAYLSGNNQSVVAFGGVSIGSICSTKRRGPVVVVDELGGSKSGIVVATSHLLSQLRQEDAVNVYFVAKMLHFERPNVFKDSCDLEFVYDLLNYVIENTTIYSSLLSRDVTLLNGGANVSNSVGVAGPASHSHIMLMNNNTAGNGSGGGCGTSFIGHYATLGGTTTNSNTHRSSRFSSLSSSLSRRHRASSAESQLFLPPSTTAVGNHNPTHRHNIHMGNRTSWNMGESRPGALPFVNHMQVISNPINNMIIPVDNTNNSTVSAVPESVATASESVPLTAVNITNNNGDIGESVAPPIVSVVDDMHINGNSMNNQSSTMSTSLISSSLLPDYSESII